VTVSAEALQAWIAAVEEGYVAAGGWVPWAEREIAGASSVPAWLVDLVEAEAPRAAIEALQKGLAAMGAAPRWPLPHASLRIGFLWLRHEREEMDVEEVLERAGAIADGSGGVEVPDCSVFHGFLEELSGGGPALPSAQPLAVRIAALFAPHAAMARAALGHLG
jgi:hypothetical protein